MKNLVRVIVFLAIAGALVAAAVYFFGVLPARESAILQVPKNSCSPVRGCGPE